MMVCWILMESKWRLDGSVGKFRAIGGEQLRLYMEVIVEVQAKRLNSLRYFELEVVEECPRHFQRSTKNKYVPSRSTQITCLVIIVRYTDVYDNICRPANSVEVEAGERSAVFFSLVQQDLQFSNRHTIEGDFIVFITKGSSIESAGWLAVSFG